MFLFWMYLGGAIATMWVAYCRIGYNMMMEKAFFGKSRSLYLRAFLYIVLNGLSWPLSPLRLLWNRRK